MWPFNPFIKLLLLTEKTLLTKKNAFYSEQCRNANVLKYCNSEKEGESGKKGFINIKKRVVFFLKFLTYSLFKNFY